MIFRCQGGDIHGGKSVGITKWGNAEVHMTNLSRFSTSTKILLVDYSPPCIWCVLLCLSSTRALIYRQSHVCNVVSEWDYDLKSPSSPTEANTLSRSWNSLIWMLVLPLLSYITTPPQPSSIPELSSGFISVNMHQQTELCTRTIDYSSSVMAAHLTWPEVVASCKIGCLSLSTWAYPFVWFAILHLMGKL